MVSPRNVSFCSVPGRAAVPLLLVALVTRRSLRALVSRGAGGQRCCPRGGWHVPRRWGSEPVPAPGGDAAATARSARAPARLGEVAPRGPPGWGVGVPGMAPGGPRQLTPAHGLAGAGELGGLVTLGWGHWDTGGTGYTGVGTLGCWGHWLHWGGGTGILGALVILGWGYWGHWDTGVGALGLGTLGPPVALGWVSGVPVSAGHWPALARTGPYRPALARTDRPPRPGELLAPPPRPGPAPSGAPSPIGPLPL